MKFSFTTWFNVISLFIILTACEDNQMLTRPRFRIKKVNKLSAQERSTDTYSYDSQGRLDTIYKAYADRRLTSNSEYYYTTVFHYDLRGKLKRIDYRPDSTAAGTILPAYFEYEYEANGNAVVIHYTQTSADAVRNQLSRITFTLVYNEASLPLKITAVSDAFKDGSITEYVYEQGNVVEIKKALFNNAGGLKEAYTRTYQFDERPNPFKGLYIGAPDADLFGDYTFKLSTFYQSNTFNKNNVLYPNLTYDYDLAGNLVKIIGSPTTTLEYETY